MIKPLCCFAFLTLIIGCASAQPTAFERGIYDVSTQHVEVLVLRTNVTATATNVIAVPATIELQRLNPNPKVIAGIQTAGQMGATFGIPWLTPVLGLVGGLYAWWAEYRNSRKAKANGVLTNNVQVARETILATAGANTEREYVDAIKSSQVKAGVNDDIATIKESKVDEKEAREEAASVVSLAKATPAVP